MNKQRKNVIRNSSSDQKPKKEQKNRAKEHLVMLKKLEIQLKEQKAKIVKRTIVYFV